MLTPKQEVFVQNIVQGKSQADAYRAAYTCTKMTDKTIHEAASRLMADSKIRARVNELRTAIDTATIMSAQERLQWLTELIKSTEESTGDKLKAADIMNRMQGEYVTKVAADISVDRLEDLI